MLNNSFEKFHKCYYNLNLCIFTIHQLQQCMQFFSSYTGHSIIIVHLLVKQELVSQFWKRIIKFKFKVFRDFLCSFLRHINHRKESNRDYLQDPSSGSTALFGHKTKHLSVGLQKNLQQSV